MRTTVQDETQRKLWRQYSKTYYHKHKKKILKRQKIYNECNKEKIQLLQKHWRTNNRKRINAYLQHKKQIDCNFKLINILRSRIRGVLQGKYKSKSTLQLLGASVDQVWNYLESQFQPGMTRQNHGLWHLDHKRPCASFDLNDPKQQAECFHYTNLQPLWAKDNLKKGAKYENNHRTRS